MHSHLQYTKVKGQLTRIGYLLLLFLGIKCRLSGLAASSSMYLAILLDSLSGDFKPTLWLTLRVLHWANASVTTVCTGCCGGVKGQMTWGKALHALAGRFIFYSEGLSFGSTAKERKHEKVGFLYGFVLLLV